MNAKAVIVGLALALGGWIATSASSLHVAPVSVQMAPGQSAATMTIRNDADKPMRAQVRVFAWSQAKGEDVLDATQALIASPPMIDVAPQATQTIRLVRAARTPAVQEETFRLLIDEIVEPSATPGASVSVQLRYSVPVFVSAAGMKPPRLTMTANLVGQNVQLKVQNNGGQHARLSGVTLLSAAGTAVTLEAGLLGYVQAGRLMEWKLALPPEDAAKGPFATLNYRVNGEDFSIKL